MKTREAVPELLNRRLAGLQKTGVVTATTVSGYDGRVAVTVDGSSMNLARLANYTPVVNDVVIILALIPGSWIVLGKVVGQAI
jgi:hypothetical protein